jgi:ergothioneine biosynthesis protein EgtB
MIFEALSNRFLQTRHWTERLCEPLGVEDFVVQSMPDASPTRWHLAHTTWFFETFLLARWEADHRPFDPSYQVLFNSYYHRVGEQFPRARRGLLTRPTVKQVFEYRHAVDQRVTRLLGQLHGEQAREAARVVELGIQHEQQHQELILTDLKHLFSCNPLWPAYYKQPAPEAREKTGGNSATADWLPLAGGLVTIGAAPGPFSFDNEGPRHQTFLQPFEIQDQLVTNGDFLRFISDGGYRRPELWLSLGWATVGEQNWTAPLYWTNSDGQWRQFTLYGLVPLNESEPVSHVSYFEADAFARWSGARLPTEAEWEHAAASPDLAQLYGEVWQWTASPYTPYPGFVASADALGEYNGKFMCNQYVLRGSSCATPPGHSRPTYRNFFPPDARWQFTGIRLSRDAPASTAASKPAKSTGR